MLATLASPVAEYVCPDCDEIERKNEGKKAHSKNSNDSHSDDVFQSATYMRFIRLDETTVTVTATRSEKSVCAHPYARVCTYVYINSLYR